MSNPNKNISDFLAAAKRSANGVLTHAEKEKEAQNQTAKMTQRDLYNQTLQPIIEALTTLPETGKRKFTCTTTFDERDRDVLPELKINLYHHTTDAPSPHESSAWHRIYFSVANYKSPEKYYLFAYMSDSTAPLKHDSISVDTFSAAPAVLGKWIAEVAPDRLTELETALQGNAPRRIRVMNPLNPKKPK